MKLEYEDRGDGLYRCVDCQLGFYASHPSGAKDASECCPHAKYVRYSRTLRGRIDEMLYWVKRRKK